MSDKHANFIQAGEGATAADVKAVIDEVRDRVARETGFELRSEVRLVGFAEIAAGLLRGLVRVAEEPKATPRDGCVPDVVLEELLAAFSAKEGDAIDFDDPAIDRMLGLREATGEHGRPRSSRRRPETTAVRGGAAQHRTDRTGAAEPIAAARRRDRRVATQRRARPPPSPAAQADRDR